MATRLQIEVLGGLSVKCGGRPLALPHSKKTRALLAYLAVVGRPQRREHLCSLFWGLTDDPRASLRWSLHKLRRLTNTADCKRLVADRHSVLLDPDMIDLDFASVTSFRSGKINTLDTVDLEALVAASRGEFLADLCLPRCPSFEAWRLYHQNAARRWHIEILRRLAERLQDRPEKRSVYQAMLESLTEEEPGEAAVLPVPAWHPAEAASRFGRPVMPQSSQPPEGAMPGSMTPARPQEIRFRTTPDGVRIAYAVCGQGAPIVRAAHWMSHLQYDWESPVWCHWIDALSDGMTLVRYDQRGNGLSDWDVGDISFEAMFSDLETVVDAAGLQRFTLLGVSQSCAVSVRYAVRHPDRVSGLILYGGFVKGWQKRGNDHEVATHEAMTTLMREGWGQSNPVFRRLFTMTLIPGASPEQMDWFDELQRVTVRPENACRLHLAFGEIDVAGLLSQVSVPTLVLHARDDAAVPFSSGREFATGIPGARFVDLDSANHILLAEEPAFARLMREVKRFVAETARP
ncbi:alpha/beta fold hydrolase [Chelativorans sp. M5D2P16]|uniref:alpha/beta fold hydrolase n=1 Tax=Chelativorans sp. M5D2P16 TaxID=3095678 RepID=UPI002ACAC826|nr:alpha/beta fold hydrolase [Chelativorans sp. M5D2P16]MDZ5698625.1 alpha/beta fold hydrolase [Chelativorans sp. M5D2P16]